MPNVIELRRKRAKLFEEAKVLNDEAIAKEQDFTAEQRQIWDRINAEIDSLAEAVQREERLENLHKELQASLQAPVKPEPTPDPNAPTGEKRIYAQPEYRDAFDRMLLSGVNRLGMEEVRALQAGNDTLGGYITVPEEFINRLIKSVDNMTFMRQPGMATKFPVKRAQSLGVPSLDNDPADPAWTSEIATGNEDSTMSFGKRVLYPHPLAKRLKVSNTLLASSILDVESLAIERLSYKFNVTLEAVYMEGTGANQPLGIYVASNDGISTTYDVSTGNTTTSITVDGLLNCKYDLKPQYHPRARWMFHREGVLQIRKLKDGEGRYLWQPAVTANTPDLLLGTPVIISEYNPHAFNSTLYVGIIGDFSFYWIADALDMQVKRLTELYAESDQTGFIGRFETDGMPVLGEAFRRVKLG